MKLRWLTTKTRVTAAEVQAEYVRTVSRTMMETKKFLEAVEGPTLQYFDADRDMWLDVPHVTEYRNG